MFQVGDRPAEKALQQLNADIFGRFFYIESGHYNNYIRITERGKISENSRENGQL
jgi:hypothetical protein